MKRFQKNTTKAFMPVGRGSVIGSYFERSMCNRVIAFVEIVVGSVEGDRVALFYI